MKSGLVIFWLATGLSGFSLALALLGAALLDHAATGILAGAFVIAITVNLLLSAALKIMRWSRNEAVRG